MGFVILTGQVPPLMILSKVRASGTPAEAPDSSEWRDASSFSE